MTRAREKLILTGTVRNMEKFAQYACSQLQTTTKTLPDYFIMQAKSYLDWLAPAIARHKDGLTLRQSATNESAVLLADPSQWQISLINSLDITDKTINSTVNEDIINKVKKLQPLPATKQKDNIDKLLNWSYPHQEALSIPAKLSVTEIKQQFASTDYVPQDDNAQMLFAETSFKRPQFLQKQTKMTATEYGSLMHTVMQHLDFHGDLSDKGILAQLHNLADREIIDNQHINKIYRN